MRDIQQVLERWGAWCASEGGSVYWQPVAAGFKGVMPHSRRRSIPCCDDDGLVINGAIARLKKKDSYLCSLLELHYINGASTRTIGNNQGISHTLVIKRLLEAEAFIEGCLMALDVKLEMDRYVQREPVSVKASL
ncbi:antitermination protein [Salmonella enterica]|nr:antitermination protein [Salmonella enterica]EJG7682001.1 antitermination protein [Salmonella enterica]